MANKKIHDLSLAAASDAAAADNEIESWFPALPVGSRSVRTRYDVLRGALARLERWYDVTDPLFGADPTGLSSSTAAFQTAYAAAAAAGGGVLYIPPGLYSANNLAISSSNIWIVCADGAVIDSPSVTNMVEFNGTLTAKTTLSADGNISDTTITVGSTTGLAAGDWVLIQSDARVGGSPSLPHLVEINKVKSITDGTHLVLERGLRNAYAFASTVHVDKLAPLENVGVIGGTWTQFAGTSGDCIRFTYCVGPRAERVRTTNFGDYGQYFYFCAAPRCIGGESYAGSDAGTPNGWCYAFQCCQDWFASGCIARDHPWDGFDVAGGSMYGTMIGCHSLNMGDAGFNAGHGQRSHHNTYIGCHATDCSVGWSIGSPTYDGDDDNEFIACFSVGGGYGFQVRGDSARNHFTGCRALKCGVLISGGSGFDINIDAAGGVDNSFTDCIANGCYDHGFNANYRVQLKGGKFLNSVTGNGITLTTANASYSLLAPDQVEGNHAYGISVASTCTDVVIRPGRVTGNAAVGGTFGISMLGARCRIIDPQYVTGNTSGDFNYSPANTYAIANGDTTPSVLGGNERLFVTANSGATSITTFDDGHDDMWFDLLVDANTTLVHGATLKLAGGVNFVGTANDIITLRRKGGVWYERGRSVNG